MTQLVELQEALPKLQAAGIKLYAVSYDEADALAEFARHQGITYPLLSDEGSKVIRRYGIQNHFVTRDQIPFYGIPFPAGRTLSMRRASSPPSSFPTPTQSNPWSPNPMSSSARVCAGLVAKKPFTQAPTT